MMISSNVCRDSTRLNWYPDIAGKLTTTNGKKAVVGPLCWILMLMQPSWFSQISKYYIQNPAIAVGYCFFKECLAEVLSKTNFFFWRYFGRRISGRSQKEVFQIRCRPWINGNLNKKTIDQINFFTHISKLEKIVKN